MGAWIVDDGRVVSDGVEKRIHWLIENELEQVPAGGWEVLYRCPGDGRFWALTRPRGEMHGGGPTRLKHISADQANLKYRMGS
jgi:hypothetical protein